MDRGLLLSGGPLGNRGRRINPSDRPPTSQGQAKKRRLREVRHHDPADHELRSFQLQREADREIALQLAGGTVPAKPGDRSL